MNFKKLFAVIGAVALLALPALAADNYSTTGGQRLVFTSTAATNTVSTVPIFGAPALGWPAYVAGATTVTNITKIDISAFREVQLTFQCQSTNTTTTSNVVWTVYHGISSTPTSCQGTNSAGAFGMPIALLGYVTNTLNGVNPSYAVANYYANPRLANATGGQSADWGIAGDNALYIYSLQTLGLSGLTNYSVTVTGQ